MTKFDGMLRFSIFILILLIIFSCNKHLEEDFNVSNIYNLHKRIDSISEDSTVYQLKKIEKILKNNTNLPDSLRAKNNYLLGVNFWEKGTLDSAAIYLQKATFLIKDSIQLDKKLDYFINAWTVNINLRNYGDCLAISNNLLSFQNKDSIYNANLKYYSHFLNQETYLAMLEYDKALSQNDSLIKTSKILKDATKLNSALISKTQLTYNLGKKGVSFQLLDSLLATPENLSFNEKRILYGDYGVYQFFEGNYDESITYYKLGVKNAKKIPENEDKNNLIAYGYANLAEALIIKENYAEAKQYLDSIKQFGLQNIDNQLQKSILKYQLQLSSKTSNNINEVTLYIDSLFRFKEEAYKNKFDNELLALTNAIEKEKVLERDKQAAEIKNLQLENRLIFLILGSLLLGVIGLLMYRQRKFLFEKQNLKMQQRLLRSQMNPHFTFNTLYAIQNSIKDNSQKASDSLIKFSRLLRLILENSTQDYVLMENEIDSLKKYMDLQLFRFPNKFKYKISYDQMEEDEFIFIPPMLLQPFIENSIEHGFSNIDYQGHIEIKLVRESAYINCTILDNGSGLSKKENPIKESTSIKLISDFLYKTTKTKVLIKNREEKGVIVTFKIPFKYSEND